MDYTTKMGAEIEMANLGPSALKHMESWLQFTTHDDGSVRGPTYNAGTIAIFPQFTERGEPILSVGMTPGPRYGLELVTSPYPYSDFQPLMDKAAISLAHVPQTSRTSVHIHVDVAGEPWWYVKNVLLWAHALEAVLFRMACAGGVHRGARVYAGEINDHRYARPLSCPIAVDWGGKLGHLILWDRLAKATTASEMAAAWGRLDIFWGSGIQHYCPHRLHMVNLASVLRQGTLEWRLFDGMYQHLGMFTRIVYNVHRLAQEGAPDFAPFALGTRPKSIDAQWISKLLDTDCATVWGESWQEGCAKSILRSHYGDAPALATFSQRDVQRVNNRVDMDNGSNSYIMYRRDA